MKLEFYKKLSQKNFTSFKFTIFNQKTASREHCGSLGYLPVKTSERQVNSSPNTPSHSESYKTQRSLPSSETRRISDTPSFGKSKTSEAEKSEIIRRAIDFNEESILDEEDSSSDDGILMMKKVPLGKGSQSMSIIFFAPGK